MLSAEQVLAILDLGRDSEVELGPAFAYPRGRGVVGCEGVDANLVDLEPVTISLVRRDVWCG